MKIWFNQTWRGTYQLIGLLRDGAAPRPLTVLGSHPIPSTPFLQACDAVLDEPAGEGEEFVEQALAICLRHGVDVFVPGRNMVTAAEHAGRFAAAGVRLMCSSADAARVFTTKSGQYAEMAARGFPVPRTRTVTTLTGFRTAYEELSAGGAQVCVKPDVDHGGQGFRIIDGAAERLDALLEPPSVRVSPATLERILGSVEEFPALVVGEYLEGPEFSVDVLSTPAGQVLAVVPRGKSGPPWTRQLVADPEVVRLAERIVTDFGLSYLNNVQVRYSGGRPMILEVNTRAASGTYQSAASGLNLPWLAMALALGEPVRVAEPALPQTLIAYTDAMPMRPLHRAAPQITGQPRPAARIR